MACDRRGLLDSSVASASHHLQMRLRQHETKDLKLELGEVKRMAQDLIDAIDQLRKHEDQHKCSG
jgi:hypothetical protein